MNKVLSGRSREYLSRYENLIRSGNHPSPEIDLSKEVSRMVVHDWPFRYGVIDNILPNDMFTDAVEFWPRPEMFGAVALPNGQYVGSRKSKLIEDFCLTRRDDTKHDVAWASVASALQSPMFVTALFETFSDTIDKNLNSTRGWETASPGFRLYLCRDAGAKEALGAHVDAMRKVLTIVIYMGLRGPTRPEQGRIWGTTLYDVQGENYEPLKFESNEALEPAAHVAFVPNRAFVMPNDPRALHGVIGGEPDVERRSIMCGYWLFSGKSHQE